MDDSPQDWPAFLTHGWPEPEGRFTRELLRERPALLLVWAFFVGALLAAALWL